jgi:hypothetical protein
MAFPDEDDRYTDRPRRRSPEDEAGRQQPINEHGEILRDEDLARQPRRRPEEEDNFDYEPRRFRREDVPNYLTQAILVTILCCWPVGIAAIVSAAQVKGKLEAGDYEGALRASATARTLCWVCFAFGLLVAIIQIAVMLS